MILQMEHSEGAVMQIGELSQGINNLTVCIISLNKLGCIMSHLRLCIFKGTTTLDFSANSYSYVNKYIQIHVIQ